MAIMGDSRSNRRITTRSTAAPKTREAATATTTAAITPSPACTSDQAKKVDTTAIWPWAKFTTPVAR
jgi:hypothetical protein